MITRAANQNYEYQGHYLVSVPGQVETNIGVEQPQSFLWPGLVRIRTQAEAESMPQSVQPAQPTARQSWLPLGVSLSAAESSRSINVLTTSLPTAVYYILIVVL